MVNSDGLRMASTLEDIAQTALRGNNLDQIRGHLMDAAALLRHQDNTAPQTSLLPIETAPRDGTLIIGWNKEYGFHETYMQKYTDGSWGLKMYNEGKGPLEAGWYWCEPRHNWASTWEPTHWIPCPTLEVV